MDDMMTHQMEKAKLYAGEKHRVTFHNFDANFRGDNGTYKISLSAEGWYCSCSGYRDHGMCPHVMTIERILGHMIKRPLMPYVKGQNVVSDVDKSIRYATEPRRVTLHSFDVAFQGNRDTYYVTYEDGEWNCDSDFFGAQGYSAHTIAMEHILKEMLEETSDVTI